MTLSALEHGREAAAKKLASTAVDDLVRYRAQVPAFFNVDRLVAKLQALDPVPPKLGAGN